MDSQSKINEQPISSHSIQPHQPVGTSLHTLRFSKEPTPTVPIASPRPQTVDQADIEVTKQERLGRQPDPRWQIYLKALGIFVVIFSLALGGLMGPAWYQRLKYDLGQSGKDVPRELGYLPKLKDAPVQLVNIKNQPSDYLDPTIQIPGYSLADLGDNQLLIPKIKVKAPIVWDSEADEASMLSSLQQGVAHYGFSARPDEGQGNVFLTGHSSYFFWDKGSYKTVFANLDRLAVDDQIALTYKGIVYLYQVRSSQVVKPTDFDVTNATEKPTLSLMTCVPVGTNLNRLVVQADLISAAPTAPVPVTPASLQEPAAIFSYLPI
jgi:LPXTG-site transpeptidase (sortase) family protein